MRNLPPRMILLESTPASNPQVGSWPSPTFNKSLHKKNTLSIDSHQSLLSNGSSEKDWAFVGSNDDFSASDGSNNTTTQHQQQQIPPVNDTKQKRVLRPIPHAKALVGHRRFMNQLHSNRHHFLTPPVPLHPSTFRPDAAETTTIKKKPESELVLSPMSTRLEKRVTDITTQYSALRQRQRTFRGSNADSKPRCTQRALRLEKIMNHETTSAAAMKRHTTLLQQGRHSSPPVESEDQKLEAISEQCDQKQAADKTNDGTSDPPNDQNKDPQAAENDSPTGIEVVVKTFRPAARYIPRRQRQTFCLPPLKERAPEITPPAPPKKVPTQTLFRPPTKQQWLQNVIDSKRPELRSPPSSDEGDDDSSLETELSDEELREDDAQAAAESTLPVKFSSEGVPLLQHHQEFRSARCSFFEDLVYRTETSPSEKPATKPNELEENKVDSAASPSSSAPTVQKLEAVGSKEDGHSTVEGAHEVGSTLKKAPSTSPKSRNVPDAFTYDHLKQQSLSVRLSIAKKKVRRC